MKTREAKKVHLQRYGRSAVSTHRPLSKKKMRQRVTRVQNVVAKRGVDEEDGVVMEGSGMVVDAGEPAQPKRGRPSKAEAAGAAEAPVAAAEAPKEEGEGSALSAALKKLASA